MLNFKKIALYYIYLSGFFWACQKKNETNLPTNFVTSNVNHRNFVLAEDSSYLLLSTGKIRFLDTKSINRLDISSTLPFTKVAFEKVNGQKNKLIIQNATSLLFYELLTDIKAEWKEQSVIEKIIPCDNFAVSGKDFVLANGDKNCSDPNRFKNYIKLYDISDFTNPSVLDSLEIVKSLQLKVANSLFILLDEAQNVSIYQKNNDGKLLLLSKFQITSAYDFDVSNNGKIIIVKTPSAMQQYDIQNPSLPVYLSSITVTQP